MSTEESEWVAIFILSVVTFICYLLGNIAIIFYKVSIFSSVILFIAVLTKLFIIIAPLFNEAINTIKKDD